MRQDLFELVLYYTLWLCVFIVFIVLRTIDIMYNLLGFYCGNAEVAQDGVCVCGLTK